MPNKESVGMELRIEKTLKSLKARNLSGWFAEDRERAKGMILDLIPQDATVGVGDSSTIRQVGVVEGLRTRGTHVINPFDMNRQPSDPRSAVEYVVVPSVKATVCDVFLTGTNAITQDGRLVNTDAGGNRVSGMFWGHPLVVLAVGRNKIVKDLDEAFERLRNVIVPEHVKTRKGAHSPCITTGECHDCVGIHRACNITTIIEGSPLLTEIHVVIVDEDLGLGWSKSWAEDRIRRIAEEHERFMWTARGEAQMPATLDKQALWRAVKSMVKLQVV